MIWLSCILFLAVLAIFRVRKLRASNVSRRANVLRSLGVSDIQQKRILGFFHPYCNAGGGGERVLWTAIAMIQRTEPDVINVVYSGDTDASKQAIIDKVKARFDIALDPATLHFIFLRSRHLVEDAAWPRFTLIGQSLGSMYLAWEAMSALIPDLYIDTMGYAFTFHVVKWVGGVPAGAYVHYPTISTAMVARVQSRPTLFSRGKLLYYRLFMYYYALSLRSADFIMANGTWTTNHVNQILGHQDRLLDAVHFVPPLAIVKLMEPESPPKHARTVFPPCDTREMAAFPLEGRQRIVLSVAQFRPEKDHAAMLHALHDFFQAHPEMRDVKMVLVGGSRNAGDAARIEGLRALAVELGIENSVEFVVNAPYPLMLSWLARASLGINTMVDEHFGINVVEYMAAGLIPVAHASAGPLLDIAVPFQGQPTGFHATTPQTFATAFHDALSLPLAEELAMRQRARALAISKFSEAEFEKGWNASGWKEWLVAPAKAKQE
ncbi:glycosyltransferase family 4 protein [Athelia psychrophila]|uniref:GDP-Man:Man(3)GlcNAc(2)-PP-Dol alpha-1,2-mannosyltransferase n=1 Tax=Athelia psychrophila TaxID=1759441 RepID=A0A166CRM4_9AGAM|nr:glycosyltransferase family 4 protein [Fibularhizoctonia sp. CBS 109695]